MTSRCDDDSKQPSPGPISESATLPMTAITVGIAVGTYYAQAAVCVQIGTTRRTIYIQDEYGQSRFPCTVVFPPPHTPTAQNSSSQTDPLPTESAADADSNTVAKSKSKVWSSVDKLSDGTILVGREAEKVSSSYLTSTIRRIKPILGLRITDDAAQHDLRYHDTARIVDGTCVNRPTAAVYKLDSTNKMHDASVATVDDQTTDAKLPIGNVSCESDRTVIVHPEFAMAAILLHIKLQTERYLLTTHQLNVVVDSTVIIIPASYGHAQRSALIQAASMAGMSVKRFVSQPTALMYTIQQEHKIVGESQWLLVIDSGSSNTEASVHVMDLDSGIIEVAGVCAARFIGGDAFTRVLLQHCQAKIQASSGKDILSSAKHRSRMWYLCDRAKHRLTTDTSAEIYVDAVVDGKSIVQQIVITRREFESLSAELLSKLDTAMESIVGCPRLRSCNSASFYVCFTGGNMRIPFIQSRLERFLPQGAKVVRLQSDRMRALVDSAVLTSERLGPPIIPDYPAFPHCCLLIDASMPLLRKSKAVMKNVMTELKQPHAFPVPYSNNIVATTKEDNQPSVSLDLYEGFSQWPIDARLLSKITVCDLPQAPARTNHINIVFDVDTNGILTVSAAVTPASANLDKSALIAFGRIECLPEVLSCDATDNLTNQLRLFEPRMRHRLVSISWLQLLYAMTIPLEPDADSDYEFGADHILQEEACDTESALASVHAPIDWTQHAGFELFEPRVFTIVQQFL
jgi:molecular chaperone DnaK (HSP70)